MRYFKNAEPQASAKGKKHKAMDYNIKQLQIIEVAEKLFADKGFSGTSIRDIAHEADINVSMISYYFGSKEKLIEALFEVRMNESRSSLESILFDQELAPLQKVYIWIDMVLGKLTKNRCFYNIMLREQLSADSTPAISDHIMSLKLRNVEMIRQLIEEGRDTGVFRENIDHSLLITTLYGTINQAVANESFYRKVNKLEHLTSEEFQNHIKHALSAHLKNIFKLILSNENHIQN